MGGAFGNEYESHIDTLPNASDKAPETSPLSEWAAQFAWRPQPPIQNGPPGVLDSLQGVPRSEITVEGTVARILPDDRQGLPHERFIVELGDGTDVFVAHDTRMAPRVPLHTGEPIEMKGEWIPEPKNYYGTSTIGVVHWTHHTDTPRHPGGWIKAGGKTYQ